METVKEQLKKAYIKLLCKTDYQNITIKDLTNAAQVSRVSYYRNFNSIDELVNEVLDDHFKRLDFFITPLISCNNKEEIFNITKDFFTRSKKWKIKFNNTILPSNISFILLILQKKFNNNRDNHPQLFDDDYINFLKVNIIFSILKTWQDNNYKEDINELSELTASLLVNINLTKHCTSR